MINFKVTFQIANRRSFRFIKLVNIGRNHYGDDGLCITAFEIFGSLTDA
jgi:hypothetical protein